MHSLAAMVFLALTFSTCPLSAFDMSDLRHLRDSGYRSCPKCDLSGAKLQGADLRRAQLQGANLSRAGLEGADLSYAGLEDATFREAQLSGASLNGARLAGVDLRGAQLHETDLSYAYLKGANLFGVPLRHAKLTGAQLMNARLGMAQLEGATLSHSDLSGAHLRSAQLQDIDLTAAKLPRADLVDAQLQGANLGGAQLQGADLRGAQLQNADLRGAQLQNADLRGARLQNAYLGGAQLQNANLRGAQLSHADLWGAQFQHSDLGGAQLQSADMRGAQFENASLRDVDVTRAKLAHSDLTGALYEPASPPPDSYVAGIRGLDAVKSHDMSGLVQLRELLQRAGHRDLEREATFSIERWRTRSALAAWPANPLQALEGALRLVLFELTTGYGLYPGRALLIMLGLTLLLSIVYLRWITRPGRAHPASGAIYRVWPSERLVESGRNVRLLTYIDVPERKRVELFEGKTLFRRWFFCALWFGVLSAFHIGWRELSIGTWLSRLQPHEYALRAQGLPRIISGVQSLISVYLIAIWALTYFGRPFQ